MHRPVLVALFGGAALVLGAFTVHAGMSPILESLPGGGALYCGAPWTDPSWRSLTCTVPLREAQLRALILGAFMLAAAALALTLAMTSRSTPAGPHRTPQ